jgi:hypothetical protein
MTWPVPQPGLVIRYSYLWQREAKAGQEEGVKDRPCAIVIASVDEDGQTRVYAVPVTHALPRDVETAIEIPTAVKMRLGLDSERSWIVVSEVNIFAWPGPDLRFIPGKGSSNTVYGFLPPTFFRLVRDRFLDAGRRRKAALVNRTT